MIGQEEFKAVFREHQDAIYRFAWRLTGSPEAAEDIAQDAFLAYLRSPKEPSRAPAQLRAFLLGIARNLALKRWRQEQRWSVLDEEKFVAKEMDADGFETWEAVAAAMALLPSLQREVLLLATYEGLSLQEIAQVTRTEVGTVKARLHRARENMKRILAPIGEHVRRVERSGTAER